MPDEESERLEPMTQLVVAFRTASRPIVHVVRLYRPGDSDVDSVRRTAVESGARIAARDTLGRRYRPSYYPGPSTTIAARCCPAIFVK